MAYEDDDQEVCGVCGQEDCPCPLCHGDPKRWLGFAHGGIDLHDEDGFPTGEVQCTECDEVS